MHPTQQLARIKLRETRRQRDRLHRHYDAIEAQVAQSITPLDRLRALHAGLREITFARKPLHPDIAQLDALYLADELGTVPPELVADRARLLERELAQGRLRAEFTYAFGRILSEWAGGAPAAEPPTGDDPLAPLWREPPALDHAWLDRFFTANGDILGPVAEDLARFGAAAAMAPAEAKAVENIPNRIAADSYALPALRRQAAAAAGNPAHVNEYAGVLTILLNSLDEWAWPADGLPLRAVWARVKHRPYLDEDLITALFLQFVGLRWGAKLKEHLLWQALKRGKEPLFPTDPSASPEAALIQDRLQAQWARFMPTVTTYGEAPLQRAENGYGPDALLLMLDAVEREIRFARAATPERPLFVVQFDLRDFYPSLSHELILRVLERLGVPDNWRAFFRRFLEAPMRWRGETRMPRRGLVLEHLLADVFADCVLFVLDLHVWRATGAMPFRVLDDVWLLADSAEKAQAGAAAVADFCRACGLEVNSGKSGAVRLGGVGPLPEGLPAGAPRWGLLRLSPAGAWQADEPAFAAVEETLRRELAACPSVLALVACYNGYVAYVLRQLGLSLALHGDHLRRVGLRLDRMHEELFGPAGGLVEEVRRRLRESFADARLKERGLPAALVYWPITAGGLALTHPLLHVATYLRGRRDEPRLLFPSRDLVAAFLRLREKSLHEARLSGDEYKFLLGQTETLKGWQGGRDELLERAERRGRRSETRRVSDEEINEATGELWEQLYQEVLPEIRPEGPPPLPALEQLVEDFIRRGGEVSGKKQKSLSPYWRWVVYTYGPSLLEALGTFRFLITELVPLQLILESRGAVGDELEGGGAGFRDGAATATGSPPAAGGDFPF
jgi:hypothetical protein